MIARLLTLEEALERGLRPERWVLWRDPLGRVAKMDREPDFQPSPSGK